MNIVFMGTPEIAATCLDALLQAGEHVTGVVTREDKPKGRSMTLTPPPVKVLAEAHGVPVAQPRSLKDGALLPFLAACAPDVIVVVAYGKILPREVLTYARYGAINVHVSLLPRYRGAAPMQRAIMAGERETGVTLMYMDEGLDTGDIIRAQAFPIGEEDTFETVHDRSAAIGARLLTEAMATLRTEGTLPRRPQEHALATYADKIEKDDCHVDFTHPATAVSARMRGVTPIPMPFAMHKGQMLKLCHATVTDGVGAPGEVLEVCARGEGYFTVACGEGALRVLSVIPAGKGRMTAGDLVRGRRIEKGDILS